MKPFWWDKIVKAFFPTLLKNGVMYCWGCQEYWEQEEKKHTSPPWAIFLLPPCKQQELGSQQPVQGSGPPRQGSLERGGVWWKPGEGWYVMETWGSPCLCRSCKGCYFPMCTRHARGWRGPWGPRAFCRSQCVLEGLLLTLCGQSHLEPDHALKNMSGNHKE